MKYYPYGPFDIPKSSKGRIAADKVSMFQFWDEVNKKHENLVEAIGCYIFSIRAGRGLLPWYVGLAEKRPFCKECFAIHKLLNYNEAIASRKGTPVLTLLPRFTATGRYAKPSKNGHADIQLLEKMLIGMAIRRNSNLLNIKNTKLLKEMIVPGVLNTPRGRQQPTVKNLKALMGA